MTTINDIAARLGISKSTVSKGLNNARDVSEEMRKKILETAVEMGYVNTRLQKKEKKLCILVENMEYKTPNQFGHDLIQGFKQMAEPDGWKIDVVPLDKEFQRGIPYTVFMMEHGYQASFVLGFSLLDPWIHEFRTSRIPAVLYDNYIKENPNIASVGCDSQEGFELAVKHLVDLGHQKIGLISGPLDSYILKARYHAYLNAMDKYGLEINEKYIGLEYYINDSTRKYVPRLLDEGVTAILFSHDVRAISAITECEDRGISIPGDVSLVGFDDLPISARTQPSLTTVRQDRLALGKCGFYALSCLLNRVTIGSILLRAALIVRDSTGPAPRKGK
ncbi:MAG: LacI family transcriptional regulator [Lachnospiraceae bacterium]|nr:LacI family transcriptional regulator [Lachnospiraceae bacterium]